MDGLIQPLVTGVNKGSTDSFRADGFISEMTAADYYKCYLEAEKQCHAVGLTADFCSISSASAMCFA